MKIKIIETLSRPIVTTSSCGQEPHDFLFEEERRIILKSDLEGVDLNNSYSIESGYHDGIRHFDHHGKFEGNPSPCKIKGGIFMKYEDDKDAFEKGDIYISHIDADVLVTMQKGLLFNSCGASLTTLNSNKLDIDLLEKIDCNGQSVCEDKYNSTLLFSIGVGVKARELKFPRVTKEEQDVTSLIWSMLTTSYEEYVELGEKAQKASEEAYKKCMRREVSNDTILFYKGEGDALNPSRAYEDGYNKVVVFNEQWKTISLYANPKSKYQFAGKSIADIQFNGHPQACGSPRGEEMTWEQAIAVYEEIKEVK